MKKKIVSALLITAIMATGLTGCGTKVGDIGDYVYEASEEPACTAESSEADFLNNFDSSKGYGHLTPIFDDNGEGEYDDDYYVDPQEVYPKEFNTEEYTVIDENGFMNVALSPLSTFSADVDTASYSNLRRLVDYGYAIDEIPAGAVRTEELINYFSYDYNLPKKGEAFGATIEMGKCPWNNHSKLLSVGIATDKIDFSEAGDSNIVFLIDVSGSMDEENKLPLLVKSFKVLLEELGKKDRVSIVTYAGNSEIVLDGVAGNKKKVISEALDSLMAGGGTNGGEGIISAYELAEKNFIKDGNNRVIIATDGDLNIGITNQSDLKDLIEKESKSGIFLTVLGFGMENYSDTNLETIADYGNGNYAYIDDIKEAKKVLCEELGATMVTVAKDVKFQIEFNPAVVAKYRLIGYEDRLLNDEDFNDDTKDAGEIGAGHTVTALYEIITVDDAKDAGIEYRYQENKLTKTATESDEWLTVSIRYKEPDSDKSQLLTYPVTTKSYRKNNTQDFLFAAAVAEFAQVVRQEPYVGDSDLSTVLDRLADLDLSDEYRAGFKDLVKELRRN